MSAPYRCPVCYGKGIVASNFYLAPGPQWSSTSTAPEKCRSCDGAGVVWPAALADEGLPKDVQEDIAAAKHLPSAEATLPALADVHDIAAERLKNPGPTVPAEGVVGPLADEGERDAD